MTGAPAAAAAVAAAVTEVVGRSLQKRQKTDPLLQREGVFVCRQIQVPRQQSGGSVQEQQKISAAVTRGSGQVVGRRHEVPAQPSGGRIEISFADVLCQLTLLLSPVAAAARRR
jgi:hypothetical protein